MNVHAAPPRSDVRFLDPEWARIAMMVAVAEADHRDSDLPEGFADRFSEIGKAVADNRASGVWSGLSGLVAAEWLDRLVHLDLDLLALALAPDARPALGARLHALQPQALSPAPCLAVIESLLMLDGGADLDALYDRVSPTAPLVASGLVRVSGEGPYQQIKATALAQKAVLGRVTDVTPPPGATLETRRARWSDLVLPAQTIRALHDFVAWLQFRDQVAQWGGTCCSGPLALFTGASGTGKSLAATVIAAELSDSGDEPWALYTLDLGRVMSKYVGETEENLNRLLDSLDGRRAILQIDEADGLFGKRGEITDARDRYANLEVSHMLSRFERHLGPVILTSNLRSNIDAAFLRRFQMVIDFPSPDVDARSSLWSMLIPPDAPREKGLDIAELATVRLSGGAIQNAAHYASVLACKAGGPVARNHLARAVWAEINKENRQVRLSEIGSLARHLEGEG